MTVTRITGAAILPGATTPVTQPSDASFFARNPATGESLEPAFHSATESDVHHAALLARQAAPTLAASSGSQRAELLRRIADKLLDAQPVIVERATLETSLPLARLNGEMGRTVTQLRLFADLVAEGSWVEARIDEAQPERQPAPRPALRSMLRPLGPVVVFGASNFPLAFSVAGGDTAAALAAGCPVLVKAHPAHPGTSELVAHLICQAVAELGLPAGTFAHLADSGFQVGAALVRHPAVKAVAFTGSTAGGQALMRLAAERPEPIPCFTEMGSVNPVFLLPRAMHTRAAAIAGGLAASFTLGSGQFCTKPGIIFLPQDAPEAFWQSLHAAVLALPHMGMLTATIAARFHQAVAARAEAVSVYAQSATLPGHGSQAATTHPTVFRLTLADFLAHPELQEEIFGPTLLLVTYSSADQLSAAALQLHGQLTATLHADESDFALAAPLLAALETRAGRLVWNGYPTGVEVSHAMVHGGPFPATSDSRFTSVGTASILRFVRPVCFQDIPDPLLPPALQSANPLGIERLVNGARTRG